MTKEVRSERYKALKSDPEALATLDGDVTAANIRRKAAYDTWLQTTAKTPAGQWQQTAALLPKAEQVVSVLL